MTNDIKNPVAQDLLDAFSRFRRLHWRPLSAAGLTHPEIRLLTCLRRSAEAESAGVKVSEISSILQVAPPTVTEQINELESRGYVERAMDKDDRRAVRVTLTDKGEAAVQEAFKTLLTSFDGLVEYLGEEQSRQLADLLSRMFIYFNEVRDQNT